MKPQRVSRIVTACCVLHNWSKDLRQNEVDFVLEEEEAPFHVQDNHLTGIAVRDEIIRNFFA